MADPKLESGQFNWNLGRGYQRPADNPRGQEGAPPGWTDVEPEFVPTPPANAPADPPPEEERASDDGMTVPNPDRQNAREFMPPRHPYEQGLMDGLASAMEQLGNSLPAERLNMDNGTGVFRGHPVTLNAQERDAIKLVLASAVVRQLDEEKEKMLSELQLETMQGTGDQPGPDMHQVPGETNPVESQSSGPSGEV